MEGIEVPPLCPDSRLEQSNGNCGLCAVEAEFLRLLREQVGHEFDAHQQYVAIAVWFDSQDLPQLARHYYRQALEERNHAMMIQVR